MVKLVGIINITPDSFSDGGHYVGADDVLARAAELIKQGASLLDIGAESTRPNATRITDDEEWVRLSPALERLIEAYPGKLSVDSHHPVTIRKVLALGDVIVNDVTGMNNPAIVEIVCEYKPTVIISHLSGVDIQAAHHGELINSPEQVRDELLAKAAKLEAGGVDQRKIILDPGIGFGKTMELNWELLKFAELVPEYDVMIGYSRKRFLGERRMELAPNLEAARIAIDHGAKYLRVHDVHGHSQALAAQ